MVEKKVDGDNVLYHYLQKELYENDVWFFQMLSARLVASLGIWFRPETYQKIPILVPYAVRDPKCRNSNPGEPDDWGRPNAKGYAKDDNSLVKSIPKSLAITSPLKEIYHKQSLGNGFIASHVWRISGSEDEDYCTRDPDTFSFIPNLVWLPKQISRLTDREGSFTQLYLQALSIKIYRDIEVSKELRPFVERAWKKLPVPQGIPSSGLPELGELSFFEETDSFIKRRAKTIKTYAEALRLASEGHEIPEGGIPEKYADGIVNLKPKITAKLSKELYTYYDALVIPEDGHN